MALDTLNVVLDTLNVGADRDCSVQFILVALYANNQCTHYILFGKRFPKRMLEFCYLVTKASVITKTSIIKKTHLKCIMGYFF